MFFRRKAAIQCSTLFVFSLASFANASDLRLLEAVRSQNKHDVIALLNEHVAVNASLGDGSTALHWAAYWDDLTTADALIRAGANVNAHTDNGVSPLWVSCDGGSAEMVEKLLAAGADANVKTSYGVSALMMCARTGNIGGVRALLVRHVDLNAKENLRGQTALMWAVAERHPEIVHLLVDKGADVHARTLSTSELTNKGDVRYGVSATNMTGLGSSTPLLFAARQGDVESAKYLVAAGANVNDADADETSAMVIAAHSDNLALGTFLLENGANPNDARCGYTALHAAVLRNNVALVKSILKHGGDPNARVAKGTVVRRSGPDFALTTDLIGATPFFLAAKFSEPEIMRTLAAAGANAHESLKDGTTPLMAAASPVRPGVCLDVNDNCALPVDEHQMLDAMKTALDLDANINAVDGAGQTALHLAVSKGFNSVVQLLVANGAKLDIKNNRGQTPLQLATGVGRGDAKSQARLKSTAELLVQLGAKE